MSDTILNNNMNESASKRYKESVQLWTHMLHGLIGWCDEKTLKWADNFRAMIADENSMFYHRTREFYVTGLLLPQSLVKELGAAKYFDLERKVEAVLRRVREESTRIEDVDWRPVRKRIDDLLREVGESLDKIVEQINDAN